MRVLLVEENSERARVLEQGLREAGHGIVAHLPTPQRLLTQWVKTSADGIVLEMSSPDHTTFEIIRRVSHSHPCPIVMFVQRGDAETSRTAVKAGVSAYIIDGLQSERVKFIMDVAIMRFHETQSLKEELAKTRTDLADRKHIERAKGILMQRIEVGEEVAYHTMRKMAMKRNQRLIEVAESVITAEAFLAYSSTR